MIQVPQPYVVRRAFGRAAAAAIGAMALFAPLAGSAQQSTACLLLERELAAYGTSAYGGPAVAGLNRTIEQQQGALTTTDSHARRIGCYKRGFLFFQPERPPECPRLLDTIDRMKRNLADLAARRDRLVGPVNPNDPGRQRILRLLGENRCGPQYTQYASVRPLRGLFDPLFEEDSGPQGGYSGGIYGNRMLGDMPTYRTLCVRTCDGYYFPISFAALPDRFEQDAQQCRSMCPSAVVELYVHENPGSSVEQMVSLGGRPYTSIPTAFLYRKEYVKGCSCNPYTLALEQAEQELASKGDPTVKVPDIVPQDESGAPALASEGEATGIPASEEGDGVSIFRPGESEPRFVAPYPSAVPALPDGAGPKIIEVPPAGGAGQETSPAPKNTEEPFQDPAAMR